MAELSLWTSRNQHLEAAKPPPLTVPARQAGQGPPGRLRAAGYSDADADPERNLPCKPHRRETQRNPRAVGSCCRSSQAPRGRCALQRVCSGTGSGDHSHGHDPHGAGSPDGTERWPRSKSWRWAGFAMRAPGPGAAAEGGGPLVHHVVVVIAQPQLHVFEAGPLLHPGKGRPELLSVRAVIQPPQQVLVATAPGGPCRALFPAPGHQKPPEPARPAAPDPHATGSPRDSRPPSRWTRSALRARILEPQVGDRPYDLAKQNVPENT